MTESMAKRIRRLIRPITLLPLFLFAEGILKLIHLHSFIEVLEILNSHHVLAFLSSASGLFVISALWMTLLITGPDLHKLLPRKMLIGKHIHLRTWIDESERHELLFELLRRCKSPDKVQFISFTAKGVLLPESAPGISLVESPFPRAITRGTIFKGILLDPESVEADFRSKIETPDTEKPQRLLMRHAEEVGRNLISEYKQAGIEPTLTLERLQLKYISRGLSFSLWIFKDVALLEPYHLGKRHGIGNLCEFAQMIIPSSDINYQLLKEHFQNLWTCEYTRPVWDEVFIWGHHVIR